MERSTESITIVDDFEPAKEIKEEPDSDEEIEVVKFVPNSENVSSSSSSSKLSITSSTSLACGTNNNQLITLEVTNDEQNLNKSIFSSKKVDPFSSYKSHSHKRYADKCYSHRRRFHDWKDKKSRCIECKDIVSEDHFV